MDGLENLMIGILAQRPAVGAPSGPNLVNATSQTFPDNQSPPITLVHNMTSTENVLIALVAFRSSAGILDASVVTGGTKIPTVDDNEMILADIMNDSKDHSAIYGIHPGATGDVTFALGPQNGLRSAYVRLEEWSGINTGSIFNAASSAVEINSSCAPAVPTTDADGVIVGVSIWPNEGIAVEVTTPAEPAHEEGRTGTAAQDSRAAFHSTNVAAVGATEGITFSQPGANSGVATITELNPA